MRRLSRRQLLAATTCAVSAQSLAGLTLAGPAADAQGPPINSTPDTAADHIGFMQSAAGNPPRTAGDQLRERYSLLDFMTRAQREDVTTGRSLLDHTAALNLALASGHEIHMPGGVFNARYLELQDGSRLIGQGHIAGRQGVQPHSGTLIRALPSTESSFVRMAAGRVRGVLLEGLTLAGDYLHNPMQDGISLQGRVAGNDGGLWDFELRRLFIKDFAGDGLKLLGGYRDTQAPMQFGYVSHVLVERPVAAARSLVLMGQCEHIEFDECRFDGVYGLGPQGIGSYLGPFSPHFDIRPNNLTFTNPSFQRASIGLDIDRCENIVLVAPWFETVTTAIRQQHASVGLELIAPRFANVVTGLECGSHCMASMRSPIAAGSIGNLVLGSGHGGIRLDAVSKPGVSTQGVHPTLELPATRQLEVKAHPMVKLECSPGQTLETITGQHMPGQTLTLLVHGNPLRVAAVGGNLALGNLGPYTVLAPGSCISFIRTDAPGIASWQCIALI